MKKKWWAVLALAALIVALILLVIYSGPAEGDGVVIGAMMPLTGDNAVFGRALQQGMELGLVEVNRSGGIGGAPLKIVFEDTQANPQLGVTAFQKLVNANGCQLVLGGMFSAVTLAVAPLAEGAGVVLLSPTSSAIELTSAGDFIFRIYPSDTYDGEFAAVFARDQLKARTAGVLALQVGSTMAISKVFGDTFTGLGGEVVFSQPHKEGETEFRNQLRQLARAHPDVVFLPSYLNEMARILRQASELGLSFQVLSISTFNDPAILALAGEAAEGVVFSTPFFDPEDTKDLTRRFVADFRSAYSTEPNIWVGYGYDVVRVAAAALRNLGPQPEAVQIRDALYGLKDFPGVTGDVTFDSNGDVEKELRMMTVSGGAFTPLEQETN